jgi:hypothetical protein
MYCINEKRESEKRETKGEGEKGRSTHIRVSIYEWCFAEQSGRSTSSLSSERANERDAGLRIRQEYNARIYSEERERDVGYDEQMNRYMIHWCLRYSQG